SEDGIRDDLVTGVQTCALPILADATLRPRWIWRRDSSRARDRWTAASRTSSSTDPSRAQRSIGDEGEQGMTRRVYLDHNASTPVHPEVVAEMLPYFSDVYGNPSSVHGFGRDARAAVDAARDRVAAFLRVRA